MAVGQGPDAAALSHEFRRRLAAGPARDDPRVVGVEHEYVVRRAGAQLDFSREIGALPVPGVALHPTNPHAYLLRSGAMVMADGRVAEVATPPARAEPGVTAELEASARTSAGELADIVGPACSLSGGSTHISVRVDPAVANRLALLHARTVAAPMMLMIDLADSPGLLVRPRPGRLELCGEYVTGRSLQAAIGFALATTVALERSLATSPLPPLPLIDVTLEPGRRRFGWYVDRASFGVDLYGDGRDADLPLADGTTMRAGDYLRLAWRFAEPEAHQLLSSEEFELVDDVVEGRAPLPMEGGLDAIRSSAPVEPSPHGRCVGTRWNGRLRVAPVSATWDWMAFEVSSNGDRAVALVARPDLARFADAFDAGILDDVLDAYIARSSGERDLRVHAQTAESGLHDSIAPGPALLPNDAYGVGAGRADPRRPGKRLPPSEEEVPYVKGSNGAVTVLAALFAVLVLAAVSIARTGTSMAGAPDGRDPRVQVTDVDGLLDDAGELWIRVGFAEGWTEGPPRDLFSAFVGFVVVSAGQDVPFGWQTHDNETTIFPPDGRDAVISILSDGSVLLATGTTPGAGPVEVFYRSASWVDEASTEPVDGEGSFTLDPADVTVGDPFSVFGDPVFDVVTGTPIPAAPPTTIPVAPPTTIPVAPPTTLELAPPTTLELAPPTTLPLAPPTTLPVAPPTTLEVAVTDSVPTAPGPDRSDLSTNGDGGRDPVWLFVTLVGLVLLGGGWYVLRRASTTGQTGSRPPLAPPATTPGSIDLGYPLLFEKGNDHRRGDQHSHTRVAG